MSFVIDSAMGDGSQVKKYTLENQELSSTSKDWIAIVSKTEIKNGECLAFQVKKITG